MPRGTTKVDRKENVICFHQTCVHCYLAEGICLISLCTCRDRISEQVKSHEQKTSN